jgi:hypothetical protein
MSKLDADWRDEILGRFAGREDLSKDELYDRYFEKLGCPKPNVFECLNLIELEYQIPAGVLRPEDKLEKLIEPVPTKNPWRWLVYRTHEGDSETEMNYELGKRMRSASTVQAWSHIENFGELTICELIEAWCGLEPTTRKAV